MANVFGKTVEPRDHQRGMMWVDQFGRKWSGVFEMTPKPGPDGRSVVAWISIHPYGWSPPVDIPPHVLEPAFDEAGEQILGHLRVNFAKWKGENATHRRAWVDRLQLSAKRMYPNNYGEAIQNPSTDLLIEAGPAPIALAFIEAAEVGNKWALGLTDRRPAWVTDAMLDGRDALKRATGWRSEAEVVGVADPAKYPDAEETAEPVLVAAGVDEDEEADFSPAPPPKSARSRKR